MAIRLPVVMRRKYVSPIRSAKLSVPLFRKGSWPVFAARTLLAFLVPRFLCRHKARFRENISPRPTTFPNLIDGPDSGFSLAGASILLSDGRDFAFGTSLTGRTRGLSSGIGLLCRRTGYFAYGPHVASFLPEIDRSTSNSFGESYGSFER